MEDLSMTRSSADRLSVLQIIDKLHFRHLPATYPVVPRYVKVEYAGAESAITESSAGFSNSRTQLHPVRFNFITCL